MKELYTFRRPWLVVAQVVFLLSLLMLQSGCDRKEVSVPLLPEQESALIERVTAKWSAMEKRQFGKVYQYTTPNYRGIFSKRMFLNKFGYDVEWELTGVEVVNYDSRAAVASVVVRVMSAPIKPTSEASKALGALPATIREKWLLIDGEWWNSAKI